MADGRAHDGGNWDDNSCVLTKGLKPEELNSSVELRSILNTDIPTPEVAVPATRQFPRRGALISFAMSFPIPERHT